jgi:small basic protein (TIGR04137 family)
MSMHPSLKASEKGKKARSVLKRAERLKIMLDKEKWKEGDPVYGLPKYKTVRIKIKKEKAEKAVEAGTTAEAGKEAAPAAATAAGAKKEKKE